MRNVIATCLLVLAPAVVACSSNAEPRQTEHVAAATEQLTTPEPAAPESKLRPAEVPEIVDLSQMRPATPEETKRLDAIRAQVRARLGAK